MRLGSLRSNRDYRLVLSGSAVAALGDGVGAVAVPWLATLLTRDPLMVSAVAAAGRLPWLLFALPAGVWTDRADRRRLLIGADGARLVLTVCTVALALTVPGSSGAGPWPVAGLATLTFLFGGAEVLRGNAAQTILPSIVAGDDLERANGQMWSAEQAMGRFVGPPLAGALIAAGIVVPFGFDAAALALSIRLFWLVTVAARRPSGPGRFWPALREGLGWMRRHPVILRLAVMLGVWNAVAVGGMTVLVLYAQDVLHLAAAGYGVLLACGAAGGVLGGLLAPDVARRIGMRASLIAGMGAFVLLHLALGLTASAPIADVAMVLEAAGGMLWNVVTVSHRQRLIPDELLGRVNSVYRFLAWGGMPFGALGAGALVSALEPSLGRGAALHAPYLLGAAVCGALLLYGLSGSRLPG